MTTNLGLINFTGSLLETQLESLRFKFPRWTIGCPAIYTFGTGLVEKIPDHVCLSGVPNKGFIYLHFPLCT
jgi:hypothetical protein